MKAEKVKKSFRFVLQGLNHLLWPAVCINCRQSISESDDGLCSNCWDELLECTGGDYCPRCGRDASRYAMVEGACPDCQGKEISFDRIVRSGVYKRQEALQKMIVAFKNGKTELDSTLGFLANSALQGSGFLENVDLFVPVPLHWLRRLSRGYNQSLVIVKKIKDAARKISTDLVRIRNTKPQTLFDAIQFNQKMS